jgi:hypothetical protein
LSAHVAVVHYTRDLQHAVGQGGFTVVDVSDDAEVADQLGWSQAWDRSWLGHG